MVDPEEAIEKARKAVTERAELPGMSLMEHLEELRKRIVHSAIYLGAGLYRRLRLSRASLSVSSRPRSTSLASSSTTPTPWIRSTSTSRFRSSAEPSSPRPSSSIRCGSSSRPGSTRKKSASSFPSWPPPSDCSSPAPASATSSCCPARSRSCILGFGSKFNPIVTIEEYTGFFLSIILGLGISFELPILIFFLALFGIVSPQFLWKNIRYAILAVFLVAAIICPSPDPVHACASTPFPCSPFTSSASASPGGSTPRAKRKRRPRDDFFLVSIETSSPWVVILSESAIRADEVEGSAVVL